ncbi:unnamed protein product, partial [Mesorhabditis spiculigera]
MPNGADQDPVPRSRVRDLARRFEEISTAPFPTPAKPAKRIGKFRIQAPRLAPPMSPRGAKPEIPVKPQRLKLEQKVEPTNPVASRTDSYRMATQQLSVSASTSAENPDEVVELSFEEKASVSLTVKLRRGDSVSSDTIYQVIDDNYEAMPTFLRDIEFVPSDLRPKIRPPSPPVAQKTETQNDSEAEVTQKLAETYLNDDTDMYEEIGMNLPSSSTSGTSSHSEYVTSIYSAGETETCTIEFDKLIKFKSDFHLNLSKKMERLRKRVMAEKSRRSVSKCTLNARQLDTDHYGHIEDDRYIYGDDWSTDGEVEIRSPGRGDFRDEPESKSFSSRLHNTQPLYQLYMLAEQEKILESQINEPAQMIIQKTMNLRRESSSSSSDSGLRADCSHSTTHSSSALTSSTSLRRDRLESVRYGSQRSLWCELPEVKDAGLLDQLDDETKQLQEAYFEVITSEASYLRSLNILITHFMADKAMLGSKSSDSVIANDDRKHLFSNIFAVRDCSERLLVDLETRLEESLVLDCLSDILIHHFETNFEAYIKYCSNQVYQDRTLRRLKTENSSFLSAVGRLESDKQCQGLDMRSFLMLPMQRITRYPLLIYAILERQPIGSEKHRNAAKALALANQVVSSCNEGARRMERTEQLLEVDRRLVYKDSELKRVALVSAHRHLVKRGCLYEISERGPKSLLHSRPKARHVYLFLFSDLLIITKQKMNGTYVCQDYAERRFVDTSPLEPENPKISSGLLHQLPNRPHLFLCVLMRNARGKQSEYLFSADNESDRERWLSAMRPPQSANPDERVYAEWDCPQAVAVHSYGRAQDDELDLAVGDHVNILRKMPDGWFYGERSRDGTGGWFPSSYVQQLVNDHTRAKNYRQRLRMMQAASDLRSDLPPHMSRHAKPPALIQKLRRMSNPRQLFLPN